MEAQGGMMKEKFTIVKPTLILDEGKCKGNIRSMAEKAANSHVSFRPHFKTHQSLEIAKWFKEHGVTKITVSSVEMAAYFAPEWDDITIAFPVNILEIDMINQLAASVSLNLLAESEESTAFLALNAASDIGIFIKIDVGTHRTGIQAENISAIKKILRIIDDSEHMQFRGFLAHAGHTYLCRSSNDVMEIYHTVAKTLSGLKSQFIKNYPGMIISVGDTPSCSVIGNLTEVDEIRPGNFVFYDLAQHWIGSNSIKQIAIAMACPIVAIHEERGELVIYGGAVHFSKESIETNEDGIIYGRVVEQTRDGWADVIPGMVLSKISQEHGTVKTPLDQTGNYAVGQLLYILPVHACLTANLAAYYISLKGRKISKSHSHHGIEER